MTGQSRQSGGPLARWRGLSSTGKRRVGEFVANMLLGMAASLLTLVVLPAFAGRGPSEARAIVAAFVLAAIAAMFAVMVRVFTEERATDGPSRAQS